MGASVCVSVYVGVLYVCVLLFVCVAASFSVLHYYYLLEAGRKDQMIFGAK